MFSLIKLSNTRLVNSLQEYKTNYFSSVDALTLSSNSIVKLFIDLFTVIHLINSLKLITSNWNDFFAKQNDLKFVLYPNSIASICDNGD